MPYLDGLPIASSVSSLDWIPVDQGGVPNVPGSATTRRASVAQITAPLAIGGATALSIAALRAATSGTLTTSLVYVLGYYSGADGGEGPFWLSADTTSSDNGGTIIVDASSRRWYRETGGASLSTKWFGAKGDGATVDNAAIAAWWAVLMSGIFEGYIEGGSYKLTTNQLWDLTTRRTGIRIRGAGQGATTLDLSAVSSGVPFTITGNNTSLFYGHFSDFTILTNIAGVGCALGVLAASDALNGFTFRQMEFKNAANNSATRALQLNGCFNCDFGTVTTNTGGALTPPQVGGASNGKSLHVTRADFCRLMGSFSGAETGIYLTGEAFSNTFESLDIEDCNRAINIDSAQCQKNTFIAGTYVAATLFDFTAGSQNVVLNPNPGIYAGGAVTAGVIGLYLMIPGQPTATPSVPATGTPLVNTTGQIVLVVIAPGSSNLSQVEVNTAGFFTTVAATVILQPGDSVTLTYTSGVPYMLWQPVI